MEKNYEERRRIGERIRQLRIEQNMTQYQLADLTGLKRPHITRIEAGSYSVGFDTLQAIAKALGCTLDFIKIS